MKIFEIGVGEYSRCRTLNYINSSHECWLFEPHPIYFNDIYNNLINVKNFKLFNYAIGDKEKEVDFCLLDNASFVDGIKAPMSFIENLERIKVYMKNIKDFDKGDIDVLLLDLEGGEFDILKNLLSRPQYIVVEMFSFGVDYVNPNFYKIISYRTIRYT